MYWDANSVYRWAMIQNMPCKDAKGDTPATLKKILKTPDDRPKGYIVEVYFEFPQHWHEQITESPFVG